jgi:hypothetical protein
VSKVQAKFPQPGTKTESPSNKIEEEKKVEKEVTLEDIYKMYFKLNEKVPKISHYLETRKKQLVQFIDNYRNSCNFSRQKTYMNSIEDKNELLCDVFDYLTRDNRVKLMSVDMTNFYLDKCNKMMKSTFKNHMKIALSFYSQVLKKYFNEIMEIWKTKLMTKCDLSREDRIKKFEAMLRHFVSLRESKMYRHLGSKYSSEFSEIIQGIDTQVEMIFSIKAN